MSTNPPASGIMGALFRGTGA